MTRIKLEAEYRKYFTEVRKFEPFPMTLTFENVVDFVEWHDKESRARAERVFREITESRAEDRQ